MLCGAFISLYMYICVLFQSKIRELEEKLGEERHHRKRMVEKAAEVQIFFFPFYRTCL